MQLFFTCLSHRNENIVKILLENNADINVIDNDGNTPLDLAFLGKFTNIVKLLVTTKTTATSRRFSM